MNKSQLVDVIYEKTEVDKDTVALIINEMHEVICETLKKGDQVKISGFGTFYAKKTKARKGRNPKTGEEVDIPERNAPKFKAGKTLKEYIK